MGSGEWGMGNGEYYLFPTPHSPFPIPHYLSFEISSKYLMNILIPPEVWPQS